MKTGRVFIVGLVLAGCARRPEPPVVIETDSNGTGSMAVATPDAEGFVPIYADDLEFHVTEKAGGGVGLSGEGEVFALKGNIRAYAYTKKPYRNFTLRFDYRWPAASELPEAERAEANTGVLVFITGEHKVWPRCLEVQGKWSEMGHIKSNARDVMVEVRDDEAAREKARKPVGEWNRVEIVAKDGALVSTLNGTKIAESGPTELVEGPIGFQAERYDVEFRDVRVREE